jgi:hypothetical protein
VTLGADAKTVLLAPGAMFLIALALGVWKHQRMTTSEDHLAHPYVDTAHRAALLYSFAPYSWRPSSSSVAGTSPST